MKKTPKSQKLWKRAKKIIPGGNSLLSKRPEMFLPEIGQHILNQLMDVESQISIIMNLLICH